MTLSPMPGSFAPNLPSLPSYPRHLAPSPPASLPSKKRLNRSTYGYSSQHAFAPQQQQGFAAPHLQPSFATPDDSDDNMMAQSTYSDHNYRSSLSTSALNSRKRGLADDDVDNFGYPVRDRRPSTATSDEQQRGGGGGKRRIIDVVGSTVGGIMRGAWQMFRPRIPFYSTSPPDPPPAPKGTYTGGASHAFHPAPAPSPDTQRRRQESPMPGQYWLDDSAPKSPATTALSVDSALSANPTNSSLALDPGMTAKWVVVSPSASAAPTKPASTASIGRPSRAGSLSGASAARTRRPVFTTRKRGLRPAPARSPAACLSSPPGSAHGGTPKKHRRATSSIGALDDDDEMDEDMRRFNERLKAMIREGKEALGAKVEVVYDDDDEDEDVVY
ncbi:hypothetical protein EDC01DRAFT_386125 [Geopyxis carbonaria]|nr:hypothetical protein EDC01DRAFT_386125 [Geopyxis carbonaria]